MLMLGDCLEKMKTMPPNCIDLIYMDPPFFSQTKHKLKDRDFNEYSFDDTWNDVDEYKSFIKARLHECKRLLKDEGSIFVHCDRAASHHLRMLLEEVFGADNFQSEIIWYYKRWSNAKKGLLNSHQVILFFSKTRDFTFNILYNGYSETTNIDQIFQKRKRDKNGKTTYQKDEHGKNELMGQKNGVPLSDVWEIPYLNPKARERTGYPTQKPILLLERVILIASNEGDIVLDPFCGSGTSLVAAKLLNREFIGMDTSPKAIAIAQKRLEKPIKSESRLLQKGRSAYINQDNDILKILDMIEAEPVQRNSGIDGFLKIDGKMIPVPVRIQRSEETTELSMRLLQKAIAKNDFQTAILYKIFENTENLLFSIPLPKVNGVRIFDNIGDLTAFKKSFLLIESENMAEVAQRPKPNHDFIL